MGSPSKLFVLMAIFSSFGCATSTSRTSSQSDPFSLLVADSISIHSSVFEVEKTLGTPRVKLPAGPGEEAWLFCQEEKCSQGRITINVNTENQSVNSVAWNVRSGDPEESINTSLSHYSNSSFQNKRFLYDYIDYSYETEIYADLKNGLTISYNPIKKTVTAIYRNDPNSPTITARAGKLPIVTEINDRGTASSP